MRLPALITTDLHLTDHPAAAYRFGLFPWINQQVKEHHVKTVSILGDITDAKDNHAASLVNKVAEGICSIDCERVHVLAGNHDWRLKGEEFFRFLNMVPGIRFITAPWEDDDKQNMAMYLPYSKTPAKDWKAFDFSHYRFLFMHQTVRGSIASNGEAMDGEELPALDASNVYSGDIHVPQTIGGVTYIGSPYHVHFGDDFTPRVLLLDRVGRERWLHFPAPRRIVMKAKSLAQLKTHKLNAEDQVKVRMQLDEADKHAWLRIKREAVRHLEDQGVYVHGVELEVKKQTQRVVIGHQATAMSPREALLDYVNAEDLGGMTLDAGLDVLEAK